MFFPDPYEGMTDVERAEAIASTPPPKKPTKIVFPLFKTPPPMGNVIQYMKDNPTCGQDVLAEAIAHGKKLGVEFEFDVGSDHPMAGPIERAQESDDE